MNKMFEQLFLFNFISLSKMYNYLALCYNILQKRTAIEWIVMISLIGLFFAMLIKPTSKYMDKPNRPIPTVVIQGVSSDPKPQVSDAISGENPESEQVDDQESD